MGGGQVLAELAVIVRGDGSAVLILEVEVGEVEAFFEEGEVDLRAMVEELGAPNPRVSGSGGFGFDEDGGAV